MAFVDSINLVSPASLGWVGVESYSFYFGVNYSLLLIFHGWGTWHACKFENKNFNLPTPKSGLQMGKLDIFSESESHGLNKLSANHK